MPYASRGYSRGKRSYRRRLRYQRPITYRQIGRKVIRDVAWLKSVVNVEKKYNDLNASTTSSTTAALVLMNGLSLGTSSTTRNGQSIKMVSFLLRYIISINASASTSVHRLMIICDTQPNAASPAIADIIQNTGSVLSPLVIANGKRFKILRDIITNLSINGQEVRNVKKYIKLNMHTEYNTANNGTIADITKNAFYIFHQSDQATNTVTFAYSTRLRYIDN